MNQTVQYLQSVVAPGAVETSTLVNCVLLDAIAAGASDVHIEPWENTVAVRIRLDGVLTEWAHLPLDLLERVTMRLKVMADLVSYQSDVPQEGHVAADPLFGTVQLRASFFPTVRGGKIVIRLLDSGSRRFELNSLGLEEDVLAKLTALLAKPSGLMLLTGPTGSGKTTMIYSALTHILHRAGPAASVSTVEDPVEFRLPMVSQSQINPAKEFTYPVALRSLLRQDPQVIMVGEIRDPETAAIALRAGLTGHLVISTIHSGSSSGVFARLMNMDLEPYLLASSVIGVVGLRLIRRNCESCTQPYEPDPILLRSFSPEVIEQAYFRRGIGCAACHQTGFSGRVALAELLVMDDEIREAILQKLATRSLQEVAVRRGMRTIWDTGIRRALAGQTPLEEIYRAV